MINYKGLALVTASVLAASPVFADTGKDIDTEARRLRQECMVKYVRSPVMESTAECMDNVDGAAALLRQYDRTRARLEERLQTEQSDMQSDKVVAQPGCQYDVAALQGVIARMRDHYEREFPEVDRLPAIGEFRTYELVKAAVFKVLGDLARQTAQIECAR